MRRTIAISIGAVLMAAAAALAQEAAGTKPADASKPPGTRLRLQFKETRQRGDVAGASRTSALLLHADAGPARLFVGSQLTITQNEREATTTVFKNVGLTAKVGVTSLPDGRYRLDAEYEDSQKRGLTVERAGGPVTAGNPVLQSVKARSGFVLREGESVPFASATDPVTGEIVRVDLALAPAPPSRAAASGAASSGRQRAQLVLTRRQGQTVLARRPYAVLLQDGGEADGDKVEIFSGSQLPVQTRAGAGQITVALKDVGAGLQLTTQRLGDGRYRLEIRFSDGVLSPGEGAPELRVFQSEATLFVREGETLTLASAIDPQTGELVEAELTLEGVK